MGILKLTINECVKVFNKKVVLIFVLLAICTFFLSFGIIYLDKNSQSTYEYMDNSKELMESEIQNLRSGQINTTEYEKEAANAKISIYEYAIQNNIKIYSVNGGYKVNLVAELIKETEILYGIDKVSMKKEFEYQKTKVESINKLLKENDFEAYIKYNKEKINQDYKNKIITKEEYDVKINEQDLFLKYEIDKYGSDSYNESWKKQILNDNFKIDSNIKNEYDYDKKEYLTNIKLEHLKNQKLINEYRLENNMPYNNFAESKSYYRNSYDSIAIPFSMFFIALLLIVLASASISDEASKGTIKFLMLTPFKRYKILLSKLLSYFIILIVVTILLSQLNVFLGNIFFADTTNEYIFANSGKIETINTNLYSLLQYLIKLPEIIIYILLGVTLSTITRNTILSNTFTLMTYIGVPIALQIIEQFVKLDFLKYLPITNFDIQSKILPDYGAFTNYISSISYKNTSVEFSILILGITAFLLFFIMFESFNKKDVN